LRGGARRLHARRTFRTLSRLPRAPTKQMGPYPRSSSWSTETRHQPPRPPLASLEDRARFAHEHLVDLLLRHACLAQRRQDVVRDVVVVPLRTRAALALLGEHVAPAVGVVREHH